MQFLSKSIDGTVFINGQAPDAPKSECYDAQRAVQLSKAKDAAPGFWDDRTIKVVKGEGITIFDCADLDFLIELMTKRYILDFHNVDISPGLAGATYSLLQQLKKQDVVAAIGSVLERPVLPSQWDAMQLTAALEAVGFIPC